jgi:hypothetical protein
MRINLTFAARAAFAVLVAASLAGPATAQSLRKVTTPAENPPTSFKGKQYVDSRGCVFIRADFGGKTTWVPRVNRKREVFCSNRNKPSLSSSQLAAVKSRVQAAPQGQVLDLSAPTIKTVAAPKRKTVKVPPKKVVKKLPAQPKPVVVAQQPVVKTVRVAKPKPVVVRKAVPAQQVVRRGPQKIHPGDLIRSSRDAADNQGVTRRVAAVAPQTQVVRRVVTAQQPQVVRRVVTVPQQQVVRRVVVPTQTTRVVTRRSVTGAPQQIHPGDLVRANRLQAAANANQSTRVVNAPQTTRKKSRVTTRVPYSQLVDPIYGLPITGPVTQSDVTCQGDAQMQQVWTNTVPRRLVKQNQIVRVERTAVVQTSRATKSTKRVVVPQQRAVASAGGRYVQVGTFGNASNAQRTIQRFQVGGVPVRTRNLTRGGRNLQVVLLGPFGSSAQAQSAMRAARGAGFGDAFYVK